MTSICKKTKKTDRAIGVYPWYWGTAADLLFYVVIDTLFLTTAKQFSETQIISLTAISTIVSIVLRFPVLWMIKKIGNTAAIRIGAFCLLSSSVLITFGPTFFIVVLGRSLRNITYLTNEVAVVVALENNLEQEGRHQDFVKFYTRGNMLYSLITMGVSLLAPVLFNIHCYLPMLCGIGTAAVAFVLSFFISDYSDNNRVLVRTPHKPVKTKMKAHILLTVVVYGLCYCIAFSSIADAKLYIQQDLMERIDLEKTTSIVGAIYFLSRIVRLLSNLVFIRVYRKCKLMTGVLLAGVLTGAFAALLIGAIIPPLYVKIPVFACGYFLILFTVDSIRQYTQQIIMLYTPNEQHQNLFAYMGFSFNIFTGVTSAFYTIVLLNHTMDSVILILVMLSAAAVALAYLLVVMLNKCKPVR